MLLAWASFTPASPQGVLLRCRNSSVVLNLWNVQLLRIVVK